MTQPIFHTALERYEDAYIVTESEQAPFVWEETTVAHRDLFESALSRHSPDAHLTSFAFQVIHLHTGDKATESKVIWSVHHALMDGYSSVLLLNKHRAILSGGMPSPSPSFVSFLEEVAAFRQGQRMTSHRFWDKQEKIWHAAKGELHLPCPISRFRPFYAREDIVMDMTGAELLHLARAAHVTVASTFYAAWALAVSQYVESDDVFFGVILSGRTIPIAGAKDVIGPLINSVPFLISVQPSANSVDFLQSVFKQSIDLEIFQWDVPDRFKECRFPSTIDIHFEAPMLQENHLGLLRQPQTSIISELPLRVHIQMDGLIQMYYHDYELYGHDIKRLGRAFAQAVSAITNPSWTVGQCRELLVGDESQSLLVLGNFFSSSTSIIHGENDETLVDLFHQAAHANPEAIAIEKGTEVITYATLLTSASRVSAHLAHWVKPGDVVCVHADRTINWIIAIYATLGAGGVYCPLKANVPKEARDQAFLHAGSRVFLASDKLLCDAHRPRGCLLAMSVANLIEQSPEPANTTEERIRLVQSDAGAYVCFTSGSSGSPKGVLCSHQSLVAFQRDLEVRLRSRPGWKIGQFMSASFDGSIHEIFSALSYGSTLVLPNSADPLDHLSRVDAAVLTPSVARHLTPQHYPYLKVLYLVGELVSQAVCDKWAAHVTTYNMYGPTEATCGATIKKLEAHKLPTLGRPNPSTRIYVLNSQSQLVPRGVIGTIHLAGVQVSQGYINKPSETAERFLPDRFGYGPGERMYKTGDRGYWDENGELRYCGRSDRELKLRGFRVDLDDIECRIQNAVRDCTGAAVVCSDDGYLLAQIQPHGLLTAEVKRILTGVLPSYMVPRYIVSVPEFPRTNAGKLDYKAVKQQLAAASPALGPNSLTGILMNEVAAIWGDILGLSVTTLDADANFLELGGHSISQLQLANRLSKLCGYSVPLVFVLQAATLGDLVNALQQRRSLPEELPPPTHLGQSSVLSPIDLEWCFRYRFSGRGTAPFNVAFGFSLGPTIELVKLHAAWNVVFRRHTILRSNFMWTSNISVERTLTQDAPQAQLVDELDVGREVNRPFDLERECLVRVQLTPKLLLLVASHIILDYTSLGILIQEVASAYKGGPLAPVPAPRWAPDPAIAAQADPSQVAFWKEYLHDSPAPHYSIGSWKPRTSCEGSSHLTLLPRESYSKLRQYVLQNRMTPHQVLLAAVSLALQYNAESVDIVLGVPHMRRWDSRAQDSVGLFLEPMPVRIRYPPPSSFLPSFRQRALLSLPRKLPEGVTEENPVSFPKMVQEASQRALAHAIPWHQILDAAKSKTTLPDWPLFDVMVFYHSDMGKLQMAGTHAKPICIWTQGSKFKLMVEFLVANDDCLLMRLEYSEECLDMRSIHVVAKLIVAALDLIVDDRSFEEMRVSLSQVREQADAEGFTTSSTGGCLFGKSFEDLK